MLNVPLLFNTIASVNYCEFEGSKAYSAPLETSHHSCTSVFKYTRAGSKPVQSELLIVALGVGGGSMFQEEDTGEVGR